MLHNGLASKFLFSQLKSLACLLLLLTPGAAAAQAQSNIKVLSLPGVQARGGDLDAMLKRRAIRILIPPSKTFFFLDKGEAYGITVEFAREFEKWINKRHAKKPYYIEVVLIPTRRDRLFQDLAAGKGDIAAGNLTITPERGAIVDFANPNVSGVKEVLVIGPSAQSITAIADLGGRQLTVRKSSSYHEHLLELNKRLQDENKPAIKIVAADEALEDEDLLEMVGAGLWPWTVVDLHKAKLWSRIYKNLTVREDVVVHEGGDIAWALRKNTPRLRAEVDEFVASHRIGTAFGDGLRSQYFGDGKIVKNALAPEKSALLRELMAHFKNYGQRFAVDPFILAAQGFQESGFDQKLRMKSGAVGVMQMKPSTAREELGINDIVSRAEDNIHSAAAYLRYIVAKYVNEPEVSDRDRVLMALAAYNGGPGALKRAREDAKKKGFDRMSGLPMSNMARLRLPARNRCNMSAISTNIILPIRHSCRHRMKPRRTVSPPMNR